MKNILWYNKTIHPERAKDAPEISICVLLYDTDYAMHGIGWYNYDSQVWNTFEEFYLDNPWQWTYLPKPS